MSDFKDDANRDPLTNEPGAHPVGTGVGAAGGAVAGAAAGAFGGPIGAAIGGIAGAVVGGLAGKAAAESVNPTAEDAYWRESFQREPYYESGRNYDEYRPAYELGWNSAGRYDGDFEAVEPNLSRDWGSSRGASPLAWEQARPATRAAWERARRNVATGATTMPASSTVSATASTLEGRPDSGDVVDVLNDLLECSRDGEYGFRTSAEHADSAELKRILERHAQECASAAAELEHEIRNHGGEPASGGSVTGAMHRGWVSVKSALSVNDDQAVLNECERGEDAALARYRKALKANLPPSARALVERQAQGVQRNHDEIKALRDRYNAAS
ncbi:PA2169 family four-helix-bundle protein [Melaminivora sp.]|uniref:ferritin-like domain-containing protein n=1 Tax=Melaminivora sp. TaxID=1933032 RepID=UPI0028A6F60D|nr:PA2169 family four-helix-bundle protein [Melaminivora sp.]